MSTRSHRRSAIVAAWGMAAFGVALGIVTTALAIANASSIHSLGAVNPTEIVMSLTFAVVGGVIASQRRRNPVGWIFLFMAVTVGAGGVGAQYARFAVITHPGLPGAPWSGCRGGM